MRDKNKKFKQQFMKELAFNQLNATEGEHQAALVLDNLKPDFNIGKIIRTAEVFSLKKVCIIGLDFFNPVPALGAFRHLKVDFYNQFKDCYEVLEKEGHQFFVLDVKAKSYLHQTQLPKKTAFILGHEEYGPSIKLEDYPQITPVKIKQFGRTESLNVSIAASLASYEYIKQNVYEFDK